jgi:hypothetical protein
MELWARMVSGNFAEMTPFLRHLGIFYMPQSCDMGPTALLPVRRKAYGGFLRPGFNPRTGVPEASMLTTRPPKPIIFYINFLTYPYLLNVTL